MKKILITQIKKLYNIIGDIYDTFKKCEKEIF